VAQKKTLRASEQDRSDIQAERAVFCEQVRQLDAKDLVFIDETGITTAMTRLYARAPRGERARGSAPCGHWRRLTVLGALSGEGMVAAMSIAAATTTRIFLAFLRAVLIPELRRRHPNATVLMDNLSALPRFAWIWSVTGFSPEGESTRCKMEDERALFFSWVPHCGGDASRCGEPAHHSRERELRRSLPKLWPAEPGRAQPL